MFSASASDVGNSRRHFQRQLVCLVPMRSAAAAAIACYGGVGMGLSSPSVAQRLVAEAVPRPLPVRVIEAPPPPLLRDLLVHSLAGVFAHVAAVPARSCDGAGREGRVALSREADVGVRAALGLGGGVQAVVATEAA